MKAAFSMSSIKTHLNTLHPKRVHIHQPANAGEHIADRVVTILGSWRFVIIQSLLLGVWIVLNSVGWFILKWDKYPFIAMNLLLSCQAAYASPLILMASNRQAARDAKRDNTQANEIAEIYNNHQELLQINRTQLAILKQQNEILDILNRHATGTIEMPPVKGKGGKST